ncbi:hypothetical protein [Reyranella soli]|uniref:Uncharacterized protein n=1 Tax=Reyranella soli TaxID=1230389 RepID=A0A512NR41_9HYPH|nr:hypothetical protein [Reyranella soli]GEP61413.1 hypothetical protein RSO01_85790 [Reyranella soli]
MARITGLGAPRLRWALLVLDRLALAMNVVSALHDVSRRNPASWRRISAIGARTDIMGDRRERVAYDVVTAGLVERHVDDVSLVMLTHQGWALPATK